MKPFGETIVCMTVIIIAFLIGTAHFANAIDKRVRCDRYAKAAVAQQLENTSVGCGFTGPEWDSNYNYHYQWCMHGNNSNYDIINRGYEFRKDKLSHCNLSELDQKVHTRYDLTCGKYARSAVELNNQNLYWGCGFKPPKWDSNYQHHLKWCKHGDNLKNYAYDEYRARIAAMDSCPCPPPENN